MSRTKGTHVGKGKLVHQGYINCRGGCAYVYQPAITIIGGVSQYLMGLSTYKLPNGGGGSQYVQAN